MEHLQGCPFCPSTDVEICRTNANACWVRCASCGADAESHRTRKKAIANWNRRSGGIVWAKVVDDDETVEREMALLRDMNELFEKEFARSEGWRR